MYPRNFLCEEAKIKQLTSSKKQLCEIGEEAIWESRFTSFDLNQVRKSSPNLSTTIPSTAQAIVHLTAYMEDPDENAYIIKY